ncbi:MAG: transglycosylase SLT domain-containing protein [Bdellovibrionales bacterium]|nr:transglycosylase SLT domain-containing protein [Bdellovibrionales bacterium]
MAIRKKGQFIFMAFVFLLVSEASWGRVHNVSVSIDENIPSPRWIFDQKVKMPTKGLEGLLASLKKAQIDKKWSDCYQRGQRAKKTGASVLFWIQSIQLQCLNEWGGVSRKARLFMAQLLKEIEKTKSLEVNTADVLRNDFFKGQLLLLKFDVKENRKMAWERIQVLQIYENVLNDEMKAEMLFRAGEVTFVEQNLVASYNFFKRSLALKERPEVLDKIAIIKKTMPSLVEKEAVVSGGTPQESLNYSEDELKVLAQMRRSLEAKDLISAVEDGVKIIKNYPGSKNADWADDQILGIFLGAVNNNDEKFELFRKKILKYMEDADPERLTRWAKNAWARGAYEEATTIAEMALEKMRPHPHEAELLLLAGTSAVSAGQYGLAEKHLKRLILSYGGTEDAREGIFRLGLLFYRLAKYSEAAFYFEKSIAIGGDSEFLSLSMYWRWRCYQKLGRSESNNAGTELIKKFPLTYYGLRARVELNNGLLVWKSSEKDPPFFPSKKITVTLIFTDLELATWKRSRILLSAGLFDEAQAELKTLPSPVNTEQKVIFAKLWAASLDYYKAISLLNEAWDENEELRTEETFKLAFPFEYSEPIRKEATKFQLSSHLVRGLIRQESSFRSKVVSPSNAYGLMQIVPITANDIAQFLKWNKPLQLPEDLFNVSQNIYFGTSYLSRMVRAFNGHVPLALAAYNAGIGRLRRWLVARPDIGVDEKQLDSSPEKELWIDELPWGETRYYVKAVLRNYLLYRLLAEKKVTSENPIWKMTIDQ